MNTCGMAGIRMRIIRCLIRKSPVQSEIIRARRYATVPWLIYFWDLRYSLGETPLTFLKTRVK